MTETITAKLEKLIYRSLDSSFIIGAFATSSTPAKKFTATGELHKPTEGLQYSLEGKWVNTDQYGKQFVISSFCIVEPCDTESITAFLEKYISGLGPAKTEFLVDKYGQHTIKILKSKPERISNECKGMISYKLAQQISEQLNENDKQQEILIKLEGLFAKIKNLPKHLASDVLNLYGLSAYQVIKNTPYILTEINRVGFILADKVAITACGIKLDAAQRIRAGIIYVINQTINETGNVWVDYDTINFNLSKLINGLKTTAVTQVIVQLINDKVLVPGGDGSDGLITLARLDKDETTVADCVVKFL